jgi:hypothetical protein
MSEASANLHESAGRLRDQTIDLHRALVSLQEELQAVDWYRQRADACRDDGLRSILEHNMEEEIEHSAMLLEWLRRHHAGFAKQFDTYLYTKAPITVVEGAAVDSAEGDHGSPCEAENSGTVSGEPFTVGTMKETP